MIDAKQKELLDDKKLLQQIACGNELAFSHFYDKYWESLFIAAFKILKDEEACKDIVQDIFLNIWEKPYTESVVNVAAYLQQTVKYKVLMALREDRIAERHLQTITELVGNTLEEQLDYDELNTRIGVIINKLPQKCREVFLMSRFENLSNKEIAERLQISIRTVETHISNAIRQIRSNVDSSGAILILLFLN